MYGGINLNDGGINLNDGVKIFLDNNTIIGYHCVKRSVLFTQWGVIND